LVGVRGKRRGMNEVTRMLHAASGGDPKAAQELMPLVYEELRKLAAYRMSLQPAGQTLQATALVHDAYLRLLGDGEKSWNDRRHFFAAAAEAMRHILIDRARRKAAERHGGGVEKLQLDDVVIATETNDETLLAIDEALEKLTAKDAATAELVKLRFFAGFTFAQAAEILGISERTAKRMWAYARAWLFQEIRGGRMTPDA
jgi:RNA polymerase sigma factor (TIGR02999 family)